MEERAAAGFVAVDAACSAILIVAELRACAMLRITAARFAATRPSTAVLVGSTLFVGRAARACGERRYDPQRRAAGHDKHHNERRDADWPTAAKHSERSLAPGLRAPVPSRIPCATGARTMVQRSSPHSSRAAAKLDSAVIHVARFDSSERHIRPTQPKCRVSPARQGWAYCSFRPGVCKPPLRSADLSMAPDFSPGSPHHPF